MSLLSLLTRDKPGAGTRLSDAMHRLTGCAFACGLYDTDARTGTRYPQVRAGRTVEAPRSSVVSYELIVQPRALKKVLGMGREFAHALNVPSVRVRQQGGSVWVDVPTNHPGHLTYEEAWALAPDIPPGKLLLGVNGHGDQLLLDLPGAPHCAVIGMSHSGKSTLLRTMVHSCQNQPGVQVALFDPRAELAPLSGHGHVWQGGYFENEDDIEACLCCLSKKSRHNGKTGWLFIFVDEAPRLCRRPAIRDALEQIANEGRHVGYHLVLGAQTPKELGAGLMANMGVTIVGKMKDAQHAAQASGQRGTGAERIAEPGRVIVTKGEERRDLQAAMMSRELIDKLSWEWPPRHGVVPSTPKAASITNQITPSTHRVSIDAHSALAMGMAGRGPDDLPREVRSQIVRYYVRHSRPPTRRMVSEWAGVEGGIDNDKWHRWQEEAIGR